MNPLKWLWTQWQLLKLRRALNSPQHKALFAYRGESELLCAAGGHSWRNNVFADGDTVCIVCGTQYPERVA